MGSEEERLGGWRQRDGKDDPRVFRVGETPRNPCEARHELLRHHGFGTNSGAGEARPQNLGYEGCTAKLAMKS